MVSFLKIKKKLRFLIIDCGMYFVSITHCIQIQHRLESLKIFIIFFKGITWICNSLRVLKLHLCKSQTLFVNRLFDHWNGWLWAD